MPNKMRRRAFRMFLDDYNDAIQAMSDEEAGALFKEMSYYYTNKEESGNLASPTWLIIKAHIDRQQDYIDSQSTKGRGGTTKGRGGTTKGRGGTSPIPIPNPIPNPNPKKEKNIKKKSSSFVPPSVEDVRSYADEVGFTSLDAEYFIDFYESKGWMVGKNKMKSWKASVRTWKRNNSNDSSSGNQTSSMERIMEIMDENDRKKEEAEKIKAEEEERKKKEDYEKKMQQHREYMASLTPEELKRVEENKKRSEKYGF